MTRAARLCIPVLAGIALLAPLVGGQSRSPSSVFPAANEEIGITLPSEESKRSFVITGMVASIPVQPGQAVKKGDTLIQLDDSVERKTLEILEIEANSNLLIEAAQKQLEHAQVELRRVSELFQKRVASETEYLRAKVEADIADVKLRQAMEEQEKKKVERDKQARQVELMRVDSPLDGYVAAINVHPGEIVDPREPAAVVVRNDPLWIEVNVSATEASALENVSSLRVRYPAEKPEQAREAKVIFLSPTVDAASGKRLVRLELPNPEGRPSGLQMIVELPTAVADTEK